MCQCVIRWYILSGNMTDAGGCPRFRRDRDRLREPHHSEAMNNLGIQK